MRASQGRRRKSDRRLIGNSYCEITMKYVEKVEKKKYRSSIIRDYKKKT